VLKNDILSSYFRDSLQENIVKFEVSAASQAVLFGAAVAVELSACSAANDKYRYLLESLDLLFLLHQGKRKEILIEVIFHTICFFFFYSSNCSRAIASRAYLIQFFFQQPFVGAEKTCLKH
tara:strand:+ start:805 stop:1167 length:363 start_codon:yes stop_codon:yes gene_type:complete